MQAFIICDGHVLNVHAGARAGKPLREWKGSFKKKEKKGI